ncbi:hypothetical protein BN6_59670 [Saccharothrix espanaensis DSM 44229]|uniref:Uncharacterized protein n=1 Tax=Saccharothrix espanaensis (strain ATCC 51144 / DSM 44229 / JCM 9112 / NBRC 15066 / NRRL 15764) TaxID=1179773 RepID=K0K9D1_SACES|nr:hypothetical protein BN6_59670 [Saccharothrix espanaensis DSM 44229]
MLRATSDRTRLDAHRGEPSSRDPDRDRRRLDGRVDRVVAGGPGDGRRGCAGAGHGRPLRSF